MLSHMIWLALSKPYQEIYYKNPKLLSIFTSLNSNGARTWKWCSSPLSDILLLTKIIYPKNFICFYSINHLTHNNTRLLQLLDYSLRRKNEKVNRKSRMLEVIKENWISKRYPLLFCRTCNFEKKYMSVALTWEMRPKSPSNLLGLLKWLQSELTSEALRSVLIDFISILDKINLNKSSIDQCFSRKLDCKSIPNYTA